MVPGLSRNSNRHTAKKPLNHTHPAKAEAETEMVHSEVGLGGKPGRNGGGLMSSSTWNIFFIFHQFFCSKMKCLARHL